MVSGAIAVVLCFAVGALLDGGNRIWLRTYESAHGQKREEARAIKAAFGSVGRQANRTSYVLYRIERGRFIPVLSDPSKAEAVVAGDAVEFRYWDVDLDASDSHGVMDVDQIATAYALFYVEDEQLKVDYGPYPPGAVPSTGRARNTTGVTTIVLAENVTVDADQKPFSHTASAGVGQGSVRLNVTLTDPENGATTRIVTGVLMRNIWPR